MILICSMVDAQFDRYKKGAKSTLSLHINPHLQYSHMFIIIVNHRHTHTHSVSTGMQVYWEASFWRECVSPSQAVIPTIPHTSSPRTLRLEPPLRYMYVHVCQIQQGSLPQNGRIEWCLSNDPRD